MTIFVVFSALLMLSLNLEVNACCQTNGCSVPWNIAAPYERLFTPACNKHDVCYSCGVRNGWSRKECDLAFKSDMETLCGGLTGVDRRLCMGTAVVYYKAVCHHGSTHYDNPSPDWCKDCPKSSGDPNSALGR